MVGPCVRHDGLSVQPLSVTSLYCNRTTPELSQKVNIDDTIAILQLPCDNELAGYSSWQGI
jgi:hypothetical protein